ncbi:MAG: hypothetical protein MUE86_06700 [Thiobacillaceae bacterium]|nr:hypothetical protein [Thiobacillaceae bacterium]
MRFPPFASRAHLEELFNTGLRAMLDAHDELGTHILVLANAVQDAALWHDLRVALEESHTRHAERAGAALRNGRAPAAAADDVTVFLKLMAIGFPHLAAVESRRVPADPMQALPAWELQFNPLRALRPERMSRERVEGIARPFDARGFHFNKPFLDKEVLWRGELAGKPARLLYNKFPFAPLHGLLVPEPELERPQLLTPETHDWAWRVAGAAANAIAGFGLAYNSYGAFASVNHLHFQSFVRDAPLPAQAGAKAYPLAAQRHRDTREAWFHLDALHRAGTAYNLIYDGDGLLLIPRARQGEVALEAWSGGFGWSEMAGVFAVSSRDDFARLDGPALRAALARWAV